MKNYKHFILGAILILFSCNKLENSNEEDALVQIENGSINEGEVLSVEDIDLDKLKNMDATQFNLFLEANVSGDPGPFVKKYYESKTIGKNIEMYDSGEQLPVTQNNLDCIAATPEMLSPFFNYPEYQRITGSGFETDTKQIQWIVGQNILYLWTVYSREQIFLKNIAPSGYPSNWLFQDIQHNTSYLHTVCPLPLTWWLVYRTVTPYVLTQPNGMSSYAAIEILGVVSGPFSANLSIENIIGLESQ